MEHWIQDEAVTKCMKCDIEFTITERKHHCRDCGKIFCAKLAFTPCFGAKLVQNCAQFAVMVDICILNYGDVNFGA